MATAVDNVVYEMCGMDEILLRRMWQFGHVTTEATNYINGVMAYFSYQRKSGDAATCFGNTLVSMAAIAH